MQGFCAIPKDKNYLKFYFWATSIHFNSQSYLSGHISGKYICSLSFFFDSITTFWQSDITTIY